MSKNAPGVFVLKGHGSQVVALPRVKFSVESEFQDLIASNPALLIGDQIDPERPRRWLLVAKEQGIAKLGSFSANWALDLLLVDQFGVPTLVEVKRSSDGRLRREVVAQMLDYAANCRTWSVSDLRSSTYSLIQEAGVEIDPEMQLSAFTDGELSVEQFWEEVEVNLRAGKIRLLFVADEIPQELRTIVEFLNSQMSPAQVLAIELRQYASENGLRTIVPTLYGENSTSRRQKAQAAVPWTDIKILEKLQQVAGEDGASVGREFIKWIRDHDVTYHLGTGQEWGSISPKFILDKKATLPITLSCDGKLWIPFSVLKNRPLFNQEGFLAKYAKMFEAIQGVDLSEFDSVAYGKIHVCTIASDRNGVVSMKAALSWMLAQIRDYAACR